MEKVQSFWFVEIGACNWNILSPRGSIIYLSGSVFASTTATDFDYKTLEGSDILLYSDFTACNDVDGEKNNFPHATDCSYSRELMIFETWNMRNDIGSCSETISESWLDSDEYIKEMETVSSICSCALETISDGGSVLIAIGRPGVMLQLLEDMSLSLESSNLKVPESLRPPISCCNPNFSVRYFSENETVIMPKLKSYADMDIVMDSEKEEQYIAKLKGKLLVEQLENMQVLSLQVKGRVDLDSLLYRRWE
ncbi:hypothetical protein P3S68_021414 [Capsicum galapagoense]